MRIAIIGYGKMGRQIEETALQAGHRIERVIDLNNRESLEDLAGNAEVALEFSNPEAACENITACIRQGIPCVSGTTGWLDRYEHICRLTEQHNGAFLYASNFSIGVNILFAINRQMGKLMDKFPQYQICIRETHHTAKKDSPSGTAITLAEGLLENTGRKNSWVNRETSVPQELEIRSFRRGSVPGIHEIEYRSQADILTLAHESLNRTGFASGALMAAEFLRNKKGCFSFRDVLGV